MSNFEVGIYSKAVFTGLAETFGVDIGLCKRALLCFSLGWGSGCVMRSLPGAGGVCRGVSGRRGGIGLDVAIGAVRHQETVVRAKYI